MACGLARPATRASREVPAYAPRLADGGQSSVRDGFVPARSQTPDWPYTPRLHVSAHRPAREPRTRGVVGHRLQTREPAIETGPEGMPIENAFAHGGSAAGCRRLDDLVAGADALLAGRRPLAAAATWMSRSPAWGMSGAASSGGRSLSPAGREVTRETHLRSSSRATDFRSPGQRGHLLDSGEFVAEIDLTFEAWRVAVEYDGPRARGGSAAVCSGRGSRAAIRDAGWDHVRILSPHLRGDGAAAASLVRAGAQSGLAARSVTPCPTHRWLRGSQPATSGTSTVTSGTCRRPRDRAASPRPHSRRPLTVVAAPPLPPYSASPSTSSSHASSNARSRQAL